LFGGAAARLVVPGSRVMPFHEDLAEQGVLLALAATAYHALANGQVPELIVGHGVLGRLLARLARVLQPDAAPAVWESNPRREQGAEGYRVMSPAEDPRQDYGAICDVSGDAGLLDDLIARLAPGGEIVLAGFYSQRLSFSFPPAFMREARIRVAAEWGPPDLMAVKELVEDGRLSLDGLITHRRAAKDAASAYRTAFADPDCLKMILDWREIE
jgi:3-hydroxyethyl bacteriochlorophyllide a dehydrogenase